MVAKHRRSLWLKVDAFDASGKPLEPVKLAPEVVRAGYGLVESTK